MDGSVHTFKARLVAKGYAKTYGIDYKETVSPVADIKAIRIVLAISVLKQASRSWNKRFDDEIKKYGFSQNLDEPCVYQRASGSIVVFIILHVDDILLMRNNITMLQDVNSWFGIFFAMKYLGEATFILGIKIYRDRSKQLISLRQSTYIDKILKKFKANNSKSGNIPM
ncbi:retrotransposon protein, putative, ty1-copia subclass [Tanacetum coccineum]